MAIAERKYKTVTKQVPSGVTLELTETEAIVLLNVLFHIGGCPYNSPRKFTDNIRKSLEGEKVNFVDLPNSYSKNGIYFEDHPLGQDADEPADFRLEAGKFYVTVNGERVGPTTASFDFCGEHRPRSKEGN
jgi:hypothetical protein